MSRPQVNPIHLRTRRRLLVPSALGALVMVGLALAVGGFTPTDAAHAVPAQVEGPETPADAGAGSGGDGTVEGEEGDRVGSVGDDGRWEGTGVEGGGATGPSPTGQARPDSSQRTLDTIIWAGLLVSLAVAGVVVFRVWRDVGVDPPLVDVDAPRGTAGSARSRRKSG